MSLVVDGYKPIVCVGGPSHGKSYDGYNHPNIKVPYFPSEWADLVKQFDEISPTETRILELTYERFHVEVVLPGLRLEGFVWKWDKLNDEDCVKAAMGLVLARTILTRAESTA